MKPTPKIGVAEQCSNDYSKVTVTIDGMPLDWSAEKIVTPVPQYVADLVNNGRPTQSVNVVHPVFLDQISDAYFGENVDVRDAEQVERLYRKLSSLYGEEFADDIMEINARLKKIVDKMFSSEFPD